MSVEEIEVRQEVRQMPNKEELEKTYFECKNCVGIAEKFGCSKSTAYNWLKRYRITIIPRKGRTLSEDTRKKVIVNLKHGAMKRKKHSEETKKKMSEARKGEGNSNYKGGKTEILRKIRRTKEYIHWRNAVLARADGKCQICGKELPLEAHHIVSIHKDISGVYDLNNGQALCYDCHLKADGKEKKLYVQ